MFQILVLKKNKSPHHSIAALLFLMLYSFVALPVELWHHHNNIDTIQLSNNGQSSLKLASAKKTDNKFECKICTHHFAAYTIVGKTMYLNNQVAYSSHSAVVIKFFLPQILKDNSNKSPPII